MSGGVSTADLGVDLDLTVDDGADAASTSTDGLDMTPEQSSAVAAARRWLDDCRRRRSVLDGLARQAVGLGSAGRAGVHHKSRRGRWHGFGGGCG